MFSSRYIGLFFAAVVAGASLSVAQTPTPVAVNEDLYTAPIVWTQYKIPTQNLSIAFPKLPFVGKVVDGCGRPVGAVYSAYAEEAVYGFVLHVPTDKPLPNGCTTDDKFGKKQFSARLDHLRGTSGVVESDVRIIASSAKMFRIDSGPAVKTMWILWDIDRWFEISVFRRKSGSSNENRFIGSLSLAHEKSVEIGSGSARIIGDRSTESPMADASQGADQIEPIVIITKPRPGYTEIARTSSTHGTVILEVTFLRSGNIGPITVLKGLDNGLTEQTISAVERIQFLPQRKNGVPETVVKKLEYIFSIY